MRGKWIWVQMVLNSNSPVPLALVSKDAMGLSQHAVNGVSAGGECVLTTKCIKVAEGLGPVVGVMTF